MRGAPEVSCRARFSVAKHATSFALPCQLHSPAKRRSPIVVNRWKPGKERDWVFAFGHHIMNQRPRKIALLGSTGSIGRSTIDVVSSSQGRLQIVALSGHRHLGELWPQA